MYLHVLRQIDFLSKALATNITSALSLTAVDLYVSAVKAGTREHFRAEVTMEGTEAKGDQYSIAPSVEKSPLI